MTQLYPDWEQAHCPCCGEVWDASFPRGPFYEEFHCMNDACRYAVDGNGTILHESDLVMSGEAKATLYALLTTFVGGLALLAVLYYFS